MRGIIQKAISGFFYVKSGDAVYECKARGSFRAKGMTPLAGDNVEFSLQGEKGVVEEIVDRNNSLVRPPVANVTRMFIVSSMQMPSPNTLLIDRQLSICEKKGIEPVIVFNKTDMKTAEYYEDIYKKSGFITVITSCKDNVGIDKLKKLLCKGINLFTGNTGVGKSSLLNLLFPELELKTGEVSEKLGRGRHTTRTAELFEVESGVYIADTAGFSTFDIESYETVLKDELPYTFKEFCDYIGECKFTSCSHTTEKGCAVIAAVNEGKIHPERHKNYCTLYDEIKDLREWNLKNK